MRFLSQWQSTGTVTGTPRRMRPKELAAVFAGFIKAAGGIMPVNCAGIENVNLSKLVDGHFDYVQQIDEIMQIIDINSV